MAEIQIDPTPLAGIEAEIEALRGRMDVLQKTVDLVSTQLNIDRKDIDRVTTALTTITTQQTQILDRFSRLEESIKTNVSVSMSNEMSPVKSLLKSIIQSPGKKVTLISNVPWYKRLFKKE